jgi:methyltransferase (TIGR00027 family)
MNDFVRPLLHFSFFKKKFVRKYPVGMYEYVIARTKIIDAEFKRALDQGFGQILIFGAGFDSRGIRLGNKARGTCVFELDAPATQAAKVERYHQKKIEIPENLVFIPIDFDRESLPERLFQAGFENDRPSLFILEGLTMYLQPESIDSTFRIIGELAVKGSRIVFDHIYASVVRRENLYEGERELYSSTADNGEGFYFGIEKGHVNEFLEGYGFTVDKILDSDALEDIYFRDSYGGLVGHVNKTHCIVTADKN